MINHHREGMCRRGRFLYKWMLSLVLKPPLFDSIHRVHLKIKEVSFRDSASLAIRSDILARFSLLGGELMAATKTN